MCHSAHSEWSICSDARVGQSETDGGLQLPEEVLITSCSLCSATRAMLIRFSFDSAETDYIQAAMICGWLLPPI
jgi:hypothetical protein